jgi:hypothetical protein
MKAVYNLRPLDKNRLKRLNKIMKERIKHGNIEKPA